MTPQHHPGEATLLAYAAGALGEALSLVVASHLAFCRVCRDTIAFGETIGGNLLDELAPDAMPDAARERVLSLIGTQTVLPAPPKPPLLSSDARLPAPLRRYLRHDLAAVQWHRVAPGFAQYEIVPHAQLGGGNLRLLRIAPGRSMPRHTHQGSELTLVLAGSYHDELGRFARGDVSETDSEIKHQPISDLAEDCICLIATEAPLRFDSLLARVFQRFTGM